VVYGLRWRNGANADPEDLDAMVLAQDRVELEAVSGLVEMVRLRWLEVFDRRGAHHLHGQPSTTAFLKASWGSAALVRIVW
jgi:hypothetical protein